MIVDLKEIFKIQIVKIMVNHLHIGHLEARKEPTKRKPRNHAKTAEKQTKNNNIQYRPINCLLFIPSKWV